MKLGIIKENVVEESIMTYSKIMLNLPNSKNGIIDSVLLNRNREIPLTQYKVNISTEVGGVNPVFRATIQSLRSQPLHHNGPPLEIYHVRE